MTCEEVEEKKGLYSKLQNEEVDKALSHVIDCDVLRLNMFYTFFSEEGEGRKALTRILRAFSVYDRNMGYCQGMHSVAAIIGRQFHMGSALGSTGANACG